MNYTNEDKQLLLDNTAVTYSRISLLDENGNVIEVFTENDKLVEWHFEDYRYVPDNGFIGQFVERLLDGTLTDLGDDVALDGKEILLELGIRGQGSEDINYYEYGNFMITSVSKEDTTGNYKFESCDYTKKFNTEFNGEREYPCTALALLNMACDQASVSLKDNGSAITYAVPSEGLEVGNYNFKYEYQGEEQVVTTYYNFSISEKLNYGDSLMLIINDNKLIERRVNEDYSITRNNLSFVTGSTGTGTLLSDEILDYVDFVNNDFVVEDNQFVESNSCRDVVKEVAKLGYTWARIDENNELCLDFSKKTEDDISTYNTIDTDKYYEAKVTGETVKPVNKVLLGMSTVDGENIVKGQDADEMSLDTIYGETSQDTYSGKNLLNIYDYTINNTDNGTFTILDDDYLRFVNNTGNQFYVTFPKIDVEPSTTYSIYGEAKNAGNRQNVYVLNQYNSSGTQIKQTYPGVLGQSTITTESTTAKIQLTLTTQNRNTQDDFSCRIQFEKGNSFTSYEQYVGGILSPNPDYPQEIHNVSGDNVIKDVGKNLCGYNINPATSMGFNINCENGQLSIDGTSSGSGMVYNSVSNSIKIPAGSYRVSSTILDGSFTANDKDTAIYFVRGDTIRFSMTKGNNYTANISVNENEDTEYYMRIYTNGSGFKFNNLKIGLQITKGTTSTDYEPYQEKQYKISLPVENLFDKDNANVLNAYFNSTTPTISQDVGSRTIYIPCKPNTTYTISKTITNRFAIGYTTTTPALNVSVSGVIQNNSANAITLTTGNNATHLVVFMWISTDTKTYTEVRDTLQIEQGSKANTYVPYGLVPIGENLFDYDSNNNELNGWFNENNTVISLSSNTRTIYMPCKPNKTYTISRIKGARFFVGYATEKPANGVRTYGVIGGINVGTNLTITTGNDAKYLVAFVYISTADTLSYEQIKKSVRIEEGSISHFDDRAIELNKTTDYEDKIFKNSGKNLFDKNNYTLFNGYIGGDGILYSNASDYCLIIPFVGINTYTFSFNVNSNRIRVAEYDEFTTTPDTQLSLLAQSTTTTASNLTFTTTSNCKYLYIGIGNTSRVTNFNYALDTIQIEEGQTATEYEPFGSGDWYWKRPIGKLILNGSESNYSTLGNGQGGQKRFRYSTDIIANVPNDILTVYCNIWKGVIYNDNNKSDNQISQWSADNMLCITTNSTTMTLDQFKEELSNNNPLIYFVLSKTQYNKITYQPLIDQLNAIQNDSLLEGTNYITIEPNDLTPTIDISVKDIDQEITEYSGTSINLVAKHYEESEIQLFDNPLTHSEKLRRIAINGCETLFGLTYTPMEVDSIGHPWMYGDDYCKITNLNNSDYFFYPFNRSIDYKGYIESKLESVSEGKIEQKYEWDSGLLSKIRQTEINVDKANGNITLLTKTTQDIQSDIEQNYYTKEMTNTLIQNAETGVTNTFSEAGGNNIFRNTGLWFAQSDTNNPYEFWTGNVVRSSHDKASNGYCLLLQNTTLSQDELVANGDYTVSFKYRKISPLAVAKCVINGVEYILDSQTDTEFQQIGTVNSQHIKMDFICNTDNGCEIYDIMVNAGKVKLAYSQNQNETITDTVNISKGITITSTSTDTTFKANADGIRLLNKGGDIKTKFTDSGTETDSLVVNEQSIIVGILRQKVGDQVWDAMV